MVQFVLQALEEVVQVVVQALEEVVQVVVQAHQEDLMEGQAAVVRRKQFLLGCSAAAH